MPTPPTTRADDVATAAAAGDDGADDRIDDEEDLGNDTVDDVVIDHVVVDDAVADEGNPGADPRGNPSGPNAVEDAVVENAGRSDASAAQGSRRRARLNNVTANIGRKYGAQRNVMVNALERVRATAQSKPGPDAIRDGGLCARPQRVVGEYPLYLRGAHQEVREGWVMRASSGTCTAKTSRLWRRWFDGPRRQRARLDVRTGSPKLALGVRSR